MKRRQTQDEFTAFPRETLIFLEELAGNNNRDWFEGNNARYKAEVLEPARALVRSLGTALSEEYPGIGWDDRTNGAGSLMGIYRDVRFGTDKSPYKTAIAMMFTRPERKKMSRPGFGLQVSPKGV
jgi:uncharacterized protein (TIGR02453 family)